MATETVGVSRVHESRPLPPGWAGKPWACQQGATTTTADTLVFLAADVELAPTAIAAAVSAPHPRGGLPLGGGGVRRRPQQAAPGRAPPREPAAFAVETRRAEIVHGALLLSVPLFVLWNPWPLVGVFVLYAVLANGPCLLVQRDNRARVAAVPARLT